MSDPPNSLAATDEDKATDADTEKMLVPLLKPGSPKKDTDSVDPVIAKQPEKIKQPSGNTDMAMTCCQCLACCGEFVNDCAMVVCCCYFLHHQ